MNASAANEQAPLKISSHLMEDQRLIRPIQPGSDLVVIEGTGDEAALLAVTADGGAVEISRDESSPSGWTSTALQPSPPISALHGLKSGETISAFAVGPDDSQPDIFTASRSDGGIWSAWSVVETAGKDLYGLVVTKLLVASVDDATALFAVLSGGPMSAETGSSLWKVPLGTESWTRLGEVAGPLLAWADFGEGDRGPLAFVRNAEDPSTFDLVQFRGADYGTRSTLMAGLHATDMATGTSPEGRSTVFLYNDGQLGGTAGLQVWEGPKDKPLTLTIKPPISAMVGIDAGSSAEGLAFVDTHGELHIVRSNGGAWTVSLSLGELTQLSVGLNRGGAPEIFGFDPTQHLTRTWEEPATGGDDPGGWQSEPIELPGSRYETVNSYVTEITVVKANGQIASSQACSLTSEEVTDVTIGGRVLTLGPKLPLQVMTNAAGRIRLSSATGKLAAGKLGVELEGRDTAYLRRNDRAISDLQGATVSQIEGLLPSHFKSDADQVHDALAKALAGTDNFSASHPTDRLDVGAAEQHSWHFRVRRSADGGGSVRTQDLDPKQLELLLRELGPAETATDFGFLKSLGTVFRGIENAATVVLDVVIDVGKATGKGLLVTVSALIDGAKRYFSGLIDGVQEAVSLAEAIMASVGVGFEELFDFLAWLFSEQARRDIWATKDVIARKIPIALAKLADLTEKVASTADAELAKAQAKFDETLSSAIKQVGSQPLGQPSASSPSSTPVTRSIGSLTDVLDKEAALAGWLTEKLTSLTGGLGLKFKGWPGLTAMLEKWADVTAGLAVDTFEKSWTGLREFIERVAQSPGQLAQATVGTLLQEAKVVVDALLEFVRESATDGLQVLAEVARNVGSHLLALPLKNPAIVLLYNLVKPGSDIETPTLMDLGALIAAFPATVLCKAITGSAPFTSSTSARVRRSRTTQSSPGDGSFPTTKADEADGLLLAASVLGVIWGPTEALLDHGSHPSKAGGRADLLATDDLSLVKNLVFGFFFPASILALSLGPVVAYEGSGPERFWAFVVWSSLGCSAIGQLLWVVVSWKTGKIYGTNDTLAGVCLNVCCGAVALVFGVITLAEASGPKDFSAVCLALFPPLPLLFKLLLWSEDEKVRFPLYLIDIIFNMLPGATGVYLATKKNDLDALPLLHTTTPRYS